jgi:hypothetical protein
MKLYVLAFLAIPLAAQPTPCKPTDDICVTARPLSASDISAMFGSLNKRYGAVQVDLCSKSSVALTVPLGMIRQQFHVNGVTVLAGIVANSVIANAQTSTKKAKAFKVAITAVEVAAVGTTLSSVSTQVKAALTEGAIGGAQIISILTATSTSASLISYGSNSLPELIQFQPNGCAPVAVQLIEGMAGNMDFGVSLSTK